MDAMQLGRKETSGRVSACAPAVFMKGDFVEVLSTVEIFEGSGKVKVHFCPEAVVRLASGEEVVSKS